MRRGQGNMGRGHSGDGRGMREGGRVTPRAWPCQTWLVRLASSSASDRLVARSCGRGWLRGAPAPISALWLGKAGGTKVGDDTWVPLGSGYGQVKGVLAWASYWAAFVGQLHGSCVRVGGPAGSAELAHKAEQAWAAAAPSSFLSLFLILFFYFVFLSLLFVANLVRV